MNTFLFLSLFPSSSSLISLLIYVAIACVVIWAIVALIRWTGVSIPQPIIIIFWAFLAIAGILFIARLFGLLLC